MNARLAGPGKPTNPLLKGLYWVVGGLVLIGALLMGAVVLMVVLSAAVVLGAVMWIRLWWLGRKHADGQGARAAASGDSRRGDVIDVEYSVVEKPERQRRE